MNRIPVLVWLPLAFVIGGMVGYYGPAEELRARETREQEEKAKPQANNAFGSFAQVLKIPDAARHPRHRRPEEMSAADHATTNTPAGEAKSDGSPRRHRPRLAPEDLRARIDEAADLWRTRSEIARSAAIARLGLDADGTESFNAAIAAMNDRLRESMQLVADEIASLDSITPELGVRLMGDLSVALAETYDAIGACTSDDKRAEVSRMQLIDLVDPSVAEPLIAVQDKLDPRPGGNGR